MFIVEGGRFVLPITCSGSDIGSGALFSIATLIPEAEGIYVDWSVAMGSADVKITADSVTFLLTLLRIFGKLLISPSHSCAYNTT